MPPTLEQDSLQSSSATVQSVQLYDGDGEGVMVFAVEEDLVAVWEAVIMKLVEEWRDELCG